jgi:hypothetical protein
VVWQVLPDRARGACETFTRGAIPRSCHGVMIHGGRSRVRPPCPGPIIIIIIIFIIFIIIIIIITSGVVWQVLPDRARGPCAGGEPVGVPEESPPRPGP